MRSSLVSVLLGLSFVAACNVGDAGTGPGGGGGDDVQPQPDAPVVSATPKLAVSIDKPTISTELMSTNQITVTLTGSDGFTGPVTLAISAVDGASAPLTAWTVGLNTTTVNVPLNGTATAVATVNIPSENKGLAATIKIDATSSAGSSSVSSAITVANQVSIALTSDGTACTYPAGMTTTTISVGSKLRFVNKSTADSIRIHMQNGDAIGLTHAQADTAPNGAYEKTPTGTSTGVGWYCHTPGNDPGNLKIVVK
jgi:hypothetical protein